MIMPENQTDRYKDLTNGGEFTIRLSQAEACAILAAYDYGMNTAIQDPDVNYNLQMIVGKLKNKIWP